MLYLLDMKKLMVLLLLFSGLLFQAQKAVKFRLKPYRIAVLSDSLSESSGLNFFGEHLFTFNDSGNTSELFQIDPRNGRILRVLQTGLHNTDWEALTNDGQNFYIGDFGNNGGARKDLKIYKIPFSGENIEKDSAKSIRFHYPDQEDFTFRNINNDFDAEAMVFLNGKIHIFSKAWKSGIIAHYILDPGIEGEQTAEKTETFHTNFVVTDASFYNGKLYLVGYNKKMQVYLMIFREGVKNEFFGSQPQKYHLGNTLSLGQIEGISVDDSGIYFSGERFHTPLGSAPQCLYFVPEARLAP